MTRSRRAFLRGLGISAAAWPFIPPLTSFADDPSTPTRLLVFYHPHGVAAGWGPSGIGNDFVLSDILSPLAPFQDKLVVVGGLTHVAGQSGPGDSHRRGTQNLLTGTPSTANELAGGITVDQLIAQHIGQDVPYPSLESAAIPYVYPGMELLHATGADQPVPPERDPYQQFQRVFGAYTEDAAALEALVAERGTVLDFVGERLEALEGKVATEDQAKIDAHLQAVRDLEDNLASLGQLPPGCVLPEATPGLDPSAQPHLPSVLRLHTDIIVAALACDVTRVATIQLGVNGGEFFEHWLPQITNAYHPIAHDSITGVPGANAQYADMNRWIGEQVAYVLARLDAIPEGDGTLLDHTLVLWCTSMANGGHGMADMPFVLAGGAGGALETGRYLRFDGLAHNALLVSVCRLMGVQIDTFGDPAFGSGGLPGIA